METAVDSLTVIAGCRSEALEGLDACVEQVQRLAMQEKIRGILVTRRAAGHFTVELSHAVPYGLTREATNEDVC